MRNKTLGFVDKSCWMTKVLSGWIQLVSFLDEDFEIISWLRRESLFWIFGLISINASVSEQASKISLVKFRAWRDKLSPRIWAWCIQMLFALREIFEILFRHVKSEVIFSGFSLFKHTWNIKNTCTLFLRLHFARLPCFLQKVSYMKEKYVVSFSCLAWIYAHTK